MNGHSKLETKDLLAKSMAAANIRLNEILKGGIDRYTNSCASNKHLCKPEQ